MFVAIAPLPAVSESPIAAIISISPGRTVCAVDGVMLLLPPGPFGSHGKLAVFGYGFCTFLIALRNTKKKGHKLFNPL